MGTLLSKIEDYSNMVVNVQDMSYLKLFWGAHAGFVILKFFIRILTGTFYDKSHGNRDPDAAFGWLEFRKRLAQNYFVAVLWGVWLMWHTVALCWGSGVGGWLTSLLAKYAAPTEATADLPSVLLALTLYTIHCGRRYYESLSQSVFSRRQVLNPLDVAFSYTATIAAGLSIVADIDIDADHAHCFAISSLSWRHLVGIPLFFFASKLHHNVHLKLAKLRKNRAGHVVTSAYKQPKDGLFDLVSCPHYLAEVLVHAALGLVLGPGSATFCWMAGAVSLHQVYLAYNTQKWYHNIFPEYPKQRRMIVPYLL